MLLLTAMAAARATAAGPGCFDRPWVHVSETSAVLYWWAEDATRSHVEFAQGGGPVQRTALTKGARWGQFHRLRGLETGRTYSCRMVVVDPRSQAETKSAVLQVTPRRKQGANRIPGQMAGPPFVLDRAGATYILTQDVKADGTALDITAPDVTLDLDGHTVVFGDNTAEQVRGVWAHSPGKATICNGHIVQGARSKAYSAAVESRWRDAPTEVFGISTDVHLRCAYPIKFLGKAANVALHHNLLFSRVVDIESRHYPGNDLLRLDISAGGNIVVHDNVLTEGCHVGIRLSGEGRRVEVHHNDIRHHQQYVNGYAIAASCPGMDIHHNRITSCGRGVHLTREGIRLHDNHLDIYGHQHLDDIPAKSRPFKHQQVELHGIKLEGNRVKGCKVYRNHVRIVQRQPVDSAGEGRAEDKVASGVYLRGKPTAIHRNCIEDGTQSWEKDRWRHYYVRTAQGEAPARITGNDATRLFGTFRAVASSEYAIYTPWTYVPATPLNVACTDPDAMNDVVDNTFIALTTYRTTRHGGYGRSGQWASAIYFVGMTRGPSRSGAYSVLVRNNRFTTNDLFIGASRPVNMSVRIEENRFILAAEAPPTRRTSRVWRVGAEIERTIQRGRNVFQGTAPR